MCKCLWSFRSLKSQGHLVCLPSILISGLHGVRIGHYLTVFYPPIPLHPAILLLSKINSQSYRPVHKQFFVHFARPLQQLHVLWRQKLFKQIYDRYTRVPLYIIRHSRHRYRYLKPFSLPSLSHLYTPLLLFNTLLSTLSFFPVEEQ